MSPSPLSDFSKLAITPNMERPSRGTVHAPSEGKGKGRAPPTEDSSSGSEDSNNEEEGLNDLDNPNDQDDQDIADIPEDHEDPEDGPEGTTGLSDDRPLFALDHCRQHGSTYAFQIAYAEVEHYSLRFEPGLPPRCSCQEEECLHKDWLLDQLARVSNGQVAGPANVDPYTRISTRGLNYVCQELGWELEPPPSQETEWQLRKLHSTSEAHRQTRTTNRERLNTVREIMATLSPTMARDDYQGGIFQHPETINNRTIFVPRDLEATLSQLLITDDSIFHRFNSLVQEDARDLNYFAKASLKAVETCRLLDEYCDSGPVNGQHNDLIWCTQRLADIVRDIHTNIEERSPLSSASRAGAAQALVSILDLVVKRNHEVYQNITWPRPRPHAEPAIARNLYLRLIGTKSSVNPAGGTFVLRELEDLPEARRNIEQLERILSNLGEKAWSAPKPYKDKLSGIIARLKNGQSESGRPGPGPGPSSSSGKRAAGPGSSGRNVKRMK
jgi:hypothetical protein